VARDCIGTRFPTLAAGERQPRSVPETVWRRFGESAHGRASGASSPLRVEAASELVVDGDDAGDDQSGDGEHALARSASDDESAGDNEGDNGDEDDNDQGDDNHTCSADELVHGAVVQEAELELAHGQAVFESIELGE